MAESQENLNDKTEQLETLSSEEELLAVPEMTMEDADQIRQEANLSQIRNLVNENKMKLWVEPYYNKETGCDEDKLVQTANALATTLEMDDLEVLRGLKSLQKNALDKLKAREKLNSSGKIELKIKLTKQQFEKQVKDLTFTVEVDVHDTGLELATAVGQKVDCAPESLKMISAGKTVLEKMSLHNQQMKPGQTVMVLRVDKTSKALQVVAEQRRILDMTKQDAELLGTDNELQITDQSGKVFELPTEERKSLIMAMSLHDKGKAQMKKRDHELALVFLLEAMTEYHVCRSELLKLADNYALLNLDIAWCYLRLGNVSELPNADQRLRECEQNFARSHGSKLERLEALKGSTGNEAVLYLRMHLLQAIVAYHSGYKQQATNLLRRAEGELKSLQVPQDLIDEVVAQGFTKREARLALRATQNVEAAAVRYAQQERERKAKVRKEERERERKRIDLGVTSDGSWVNLGYLNTLTKMGFEEPLAAKALRHTNNDIDRAIEVMNESPEMLLMEFPEEDVEVTKAMIDTVVNMGFSRDTAKEALNRCKGDIGQAIDLISKNPAFAKKVSEDYSREQAKKKEARQRMKADLGDEEDHLDVTLEEEETYLEQYRNLMGL